MQMFIKIKLERQDCQHNNDVPYPHIEMESTATIRMVKSETERYVNVPASQLEIRNLARTYGNHEQLQSIWNNEQKEGATMMVMKRLNPILSDSDTSDEDESTTRFVCFLQLFQTKDAMQDSLAVQNSRPPQMPPKMGPIVKIDVSESDSDSENSKTSSSNSSTDSSDSSRSFVRKRRIDKTQEIGINTREKLPADLCRYLDEFPHYNYEDQPVKKQPKQMPSLRCEGSAPAAQIAQEQSPLSLKQTISSTTIEEKPLPLVADRVSVATVTNSTPSTAAQNGRIAALFDIVPEKRDFVVVVVSDEPALQAAPILNVFFDAFRKQSHDLEKLRFDERSSTILHLNELWITCEDEATCKWLTEHAQDLPALHSVRRYRDHFCLQSFTVVIPCVSVSQDVLNVFDVLQKQNPGVDTSLWAVQQRRTLTDDSDECHDRVVCRFCTNEVLTLLIDEDTVRHLQVESFRLKYCFWKVEFQKCNTLN